MKPINTLVARYDDCGVDAAPDFGAQRPRRRKGKATRTQPLANDPRWRPDRGPGGALWLRYRGRLRRGRAPRGTDALFDLGKAISELGEVHAMLSRAYEIERHRPNSRARAAAVAAAMGRLALASRFLDEVAIRCGVAPADCLPTGKRQ